MQSLGAGAEGGLGWGGGAVQAACGREAGGAGEEGRGVERSRLIYGEQELFIHTHQNKKQTRDRIYIYWPPEGEPRFDSATHVQTPRRRAKSFPLPFSRSPGIT